VRAPTPAHPDASVPRLPKKARDYGIRIIGELVFWQKLGVQVDQFS
jgi:hypothetical protein